MSIHQILGKNVNRREFLKQSAMTAVGLAGLLSACAPTLKETKQDVAEIKWDCNPGG
jgi:hypothetical protein